MVVKTYTPQDTICVAGGVAALDWDNIYTASPDKEDVAKDIFGMYKRIKNKNWELQDLFIEVPAFSNTALAFNLAITSGLPFPVALFTKDPAGLLFNSKFMFPAIFTKPPEQVYGRTIPTLLYRIRGVERTVL